MLVYHLTNITFLSSVLSSDAHQFLSEVNYHFYGFVLMHLRIFMGNERTIIFKTKKMSPTLSKRSAKKFSQIENYARYDFLVPFYYHRYVFSTLKYQIFDTPPWEKQCNWIENPPSSSENLKMSLDMDSSYSITCHLITQMTILLLKWTKWWY